MKYDNMFDRDLCVNIKGISMILIVIHHIYLHYDNNIEIPRLFQIIFSSLGGLSTAVFFFLSGYGLLCSISHNSPITNKYVISHAKKIITPPYTVFVLPLLCIFLQMKVYQ